MKNFPKIKATILPFYTEIFKDIRGKKIKLLELGICEGDSLLFWNEFFDGAEIFGIDLSLPNIEVPESVKMFKCRQEDQSGLITIGKNCGPFDIIIDDCSHQKRWTWESFLTLWRYLVFGGIYIIEDWKAGFDDNGHGTLLYHGLQDVIAEIIKNADRFNVIEVRAIRKGGSIALIYKGEKQI